MKTCVVIPARHASSRFPGKPLVPLLGKPMILWVAELSASAVGREHVYVATDDAAIANVARDAGFGAVMTGHALTGTDRVAEAARALDYDVFVNVQGDEPLVDPSDITACIAAKRDSMDAVINGFTWLGADEDPAASDIPKVIASESGDMVYMSRAPIPGFKSGRSPPRYAKQVCIYCFAAGQLADFAAFGRKSVLEACEDIEILRFIELGQRVQMVECRPGSLAVDRPEDVAGVEAALRARIALRRTDP